MTTVHSGYYCSTMPAPARVPSVLRTLMVCLALVANLLATGGPLLHAAVHELHEARDARDDHNRHGHHHHDERVVASGGVVDHLDDEIHPASLHEDCPLLLRSACFVGIPSSTPGLQAVVTPGVNAPVLRPVSSPLSRAPPPGDPARAPPLA